MAMQLFSFGHPCEHQLRRTCIGGSSCPLHGYPDTWCCSFVKGKINFKRDKPCEGPRCRWGFTHPTQAQFDAVTQVIADGKAIATKLDESGADDMLQFQVDSQHVVDTVQCALHVMKHPPSSCGKKIGQLLAYAAVKAQEPKVFTQLLKTMKKPIDSYLLGAYDFLAHMKPPGTGGGGSSAASSAPKKSGGGGSKSKDDVIEDLRSDIVDVMGAALSQNGQLVVRDDQQQLQFVFINALKTFPKNKKKQEMLEVALSKYKFPPPGAVPPAPPCVIDTPELPPAAPAAPAKVEKRVDPVKAVAPVDDLPTRAGTSSAAPPLATTAQKREASGVSLQQQQQQVQQVRRIVGMSRVPNPLPQKSRFYTPMLPVDVNIPTETLLLGGLLGLHPKQPSLLGPASSLMASSLSEGNSPLRALGEGSAPTSSTAPLGVSDGSNLATFSIFGSQPIVGAATTFPSADRSLLEGVMHAWGQ